MVLFKRKPVRYLTPPTIEDEDAEIWIIPQTEEIFIDYETYLNRLDFYKQARFICQITGHSGLSFFEALKSELAGAREVEEAFPEALKGPVLRRVQFQTISRIDTLVDSIFDEFKADYYPGEGVTVHVVTGERLTGVVREKTRFGAKQLPNGEMTPAFSRYFVSLDSRPLEEAVVDDAHITRDRKIFTKQVLRSFIKKTVTREAWTGAPWIVRPEVGAQYHIDGRVPAHLRHENKVAQKKESQAAKKTAPPPEYEGMVSNFQAKGLPELKPKNQKSKGNSGPKQQRIQFLHPINHQQPLPPGMNPSQYIQPPFQMQMHPYQPHGMPPPGPPMLGPPPPGYTFQNATYSFQPPPQHSIPRMPQIPQPLPPPPPIKYPIEDLQIPMRAGSARKVRPQLKFFSDDTPVKLEDNSAQGSGILMESVGPLLETWDTLNVYCEVFQLDSFTFDDFVEAMQFTSEDADCELFVESHCAALKLLVDSEADGGKVLIQLPEMDTDSDEEDDSANDDSVVHEPTPEPEPKPKGRATRSSLAKAEAEALRAEAERELAPEPTITHQGAEMQAGNDWVEKLRKRDFKNGGWQVIMVGLLHQLSKGQRHEKLCEELLIKLAPFDKEPTQETAMLQYASLDINLRVKALQILCMLTVETKAIRAFMEEGAETMTGYRKQKIQWQRDRRIALDELRILNEERKILLPANTIPSPEPDNKELEDVKMSEVEENGTQNHDYGEDETMDTDDSPRPARPARPARTLRGGNDRATERALKRKLEEERKAKAEAAAKIPKQSKQFIKILKDIQKKQDQINKCEDEIAVLDNDLREADCPRTRVLGKDRFWNRYYWFERNGMPYAGIPDSSTADAKYANGRVWVQGPDDLEREGYIDMKDEWQTEYQLRFETTVPARKKVEEGPTSVYNARQWGYIDNPKDIDELIDWLDPRGLNELKLSKELKLYRDKIVHHMDARKEYLQPAEPRLEEVGKRMSTRKQQHADHAAHRCLNWHNTMAIHANGHVHSEQPRARKPPASRKKVVFEERETRSEKKAKDKGPSRQGT